MTWDPALEVAFHPKVVAMVGMSAGVKRGEAQPVGGTSFITSYEQLGFQGRIYPVNPKATEIMGYKAYPNVSSIPEPVDLVIISVPAPAVPGVLEDCIDANARNIHIYTSGFEETGYEEARELGNKVRQIALDGGLRVIGPNCMGLYVPEAGIGSFERLSKESGLVAFLSQSGGHCNWFSHYGPNYGIRFSKSISFGNAYVLDSTDYLEYLAVDPDTEIICMYLEGVKDGRKLLRQVQVINRVKPVILWKAGLTELGARAVASHTASLAGSRDIWETAITQAGALSAENFEELADLAVSFYFLPPIPGTRVGIVGGGGGSGVLAADQCEEAGLDVIPLPTEIREELKSKDIPVWDWIGNPIDISILGGANLTAADMLQMMARHPNFDFLMGNINEGAPTTEEGLILMLKHDIQGYLKIKQENAKSLIMVVEEKSLGTNDYNKWTEELSVVRTKLLAANIPVYPSVGRAARAVRKLIDYYRKRGQFTTLL